MEKNIIELLTVNRDAIATNRGFYYQYLVLMKQWLQNFIIDNNVELYTEVDEDIKQIGDELVFTQVKCYTQDFNLNSKEIKQSIYNFFIHFFSNRDVISDISFVFHTNTSIKKNEKLLPRWISAQPNIKNNIEVFNDCTRRVNNILESEIKRNRNIRLSSAKSSQERKDSINAAFSQLSSQLNDLIVADFTSKLVWQFSNEMPEKSIHKILGEIQVLLSHNKFENRPTKVLMNAFLSEIYYCSQNQDKTRRLLTNVRVVDILQKTDSELKKFADKKLLSLFNSSLNDLHNAVTQLQIEQARQNQEINALKQNSFSQSDIPKALTSIPFVNTHNVFGREQCIKDIHRYLIENKNLVLVGIRGLGKRTITKTYVELYKEQYKHIIWINAEDGFERSILSNENLIFNLNLEFDDCKSQKQQLVKIQNALEKLPGNNLFVICNYSEDFLKIEQFVSLKQWQFIFTTQIVINNLFTYKIPFLEYESARKLYLHYNPNVETEQLRDFFEAIDYNTLVIELTAKTITNSLDLTLAKFMELFLSQKLDDSELEIELKSDKNSEKIFSTLQNVFDLAGLSTNEKSTLDFMALLPSETRISDLVAMCGDSFQKGNKLTFANIFNELHNKGWVERDGDIVKIHKIVQQMIIYRERKRVTRFTAYVIFISWLQARFQEGFKGNPNVSFRFLSYGESILNAIKEEYREGMYQPLFALENEVLNVYRWTITDRDILNRWKSLLSRATDYLDSDDILLGIINNNYAMALMPYKEYELVEQLLKQAIEIFKHHEAKAPHHLLNGLNNLSILYLEECNFSAFDEAFKECEKLREKYNIKFDKTLAAQANAVGLANDKAGNYSEAIRSFRWAVQLHSHIEKKAANDLDLIMYLNNLAFGLFILGNIEEAIKWQKKALGLCGQFNFRNDKIKLFTMQALISMYTVSGDYEAAEALKIKLINNFGNVAPTLQ